QGHVQALLPAAAGEEELETESRLADAGVALDQVDVTGGESACENVVETQNARGGRRGRGRGLALHGCISPSVDRVRQKAPAGRMRKPCPGRRSRGAGLRFRIRIRPCPRRDEE